MKFLIEPDDGIEALIKGIDKAKKNIAIMIFRFDQEKIERALERAAERGVVVNALIAFTNHGGERNLRKLEMRFLEKGVIVARSANDLVRYHGKFMIVDHKELYLLGFNFTHLDIEHSRSFGVVTKNPQLVQEAMKLLEADRLRQAYQPASRKFLVSPLNARKELAAFIKGAKKQLLVYDPKVSDRAMLQLLQERAARGVEIRLIGRIAKPIAGAEVRGLVRLRLHTRTIVRDGKMAFLGSQSLRQVELDARREVGIIFRDAKAIKAILRVFASDWKVAEAVLPEPEIKAAAVAPKQVKRLAKAITKQIPVAPVVGKVVDKVVKEVEGVELDEREVHEVVDSAVKDAVKEAVKDAAKEVVRDAMGDVIEKKEAA